MMGDEHMVTPPAATEPPATAAGKAVKRRPHASDDPALPIHSGQRHAHWLALLVGSVFLLVLLPAHKELLRDFSAGDYMIALVLIFPLVGIGLLAWGLRSWRDYRFFGPTPLQPDPAPGQAGGQVGGAIRLSRPWGRGHDLTAMLSCIRIRRSRNSSSGMEQLLWQHAQQASGSSHLRGSLLRFCFDVPASLPPSGEDDDGRIVWRLHVQGTVEDRSFERAWDIPVSPGVARSSQQLPARQQRDDRAQREAEARESATAQIRIHPIGSGLTLHSRAGRQPGQCAALALVGGVFCAAGGWLSYEILRGEWLLLLMAPAFLLIGLLILGSAVWMLGRSLQVTIRNGAVTSRRRWLGLPLGTRSGRLEQISQLTLTTPMRAGSGARSKAFLNLYATQEDGKLRLAESIAGDNAAQALRQVIADTLRLQ